MLIGLPKTLARENGIKKAVVMLSLGVGFATVGFVFAVIMKGDNYFGGYVGNIIGAYVALWIFFVFAVGLLVAASKLDPKKPAAPQQAYRPQQPYGQPYQPQPQPQQPYQQQYRPQPQPQPQQQPQQRPMDNNNPYRY